ncbi:MAG: pantoate--beta-alanine ligase [Ignavibacteria bacterium]|nr:pantoate--beta-alanine ligase [Ignavibacteria bacterium]
MKIIYTAKEMTEISCELIKAGKTIGFVPTMGALHLGHLSLFEAVKQYADVAMASIFVNPTQFAPNEDFDKYPRDLKKDVEMAELYGIDYVFAPSNDEMYSKNFLTNIHLDGITKVFEGERRPTHFDGVALVVAKLFNIIKPHYAFFGQKDYQQTLVIKQMVKDLNFDIDVVVRPTVRLENGLAMSSRNNYLTDDEKEKATIIYKSMLEAKSAISLGERNKEKIVKIIVEKIAEVPELKIDYVAVVKQKDLSEVDNFVSGDEIVILIAAFLGKTRLIDNMLITV